MAILSAEIFVECFQSFSTKFLFQAHRCDKIFGNPPEFSSVAVSYTHLDVYKRQMNGRTEIITNVSTGSIVMVMQMPPMSKIGARIPILCIIPMTWLTL